MPINYKEYSKNWRWLASQLRKAAGDKCELCFAPNGKNICRSENAMSSNEYPWRHQTESDVVDEEKTTKIVLTVHHIDSDKNNNTRPNLIVLCQRCHLRLDLEKHIRNRKNNQIKKRTSGSDRLL